MLTLTLGLPAVRRRRAGGIVYTNTAFVSTTGDDGTGELNDPDLPFETHGAAAAALFAEYGNAEVTVRVLDDGWDATLDFDGAVPAWNGIAYWILRGHGAVKTVTGTIDGTVPSAQGRDIVLWDIELDTYDGSGGDGVSGDDDGFRGGDVYLIADALVTTFTSPGGAPSGAGAAGADGRERIVMMSMDGEPQRNMDGTFATQMS
jgi:hypothetical protein